MCYIYILVDIYIQSLHNCGADSGGPLFLQHNHAPSMGILPDGKTLMLAWFSTVTENGREPSYLLRPRILLSTDPFCTATLYCFSSAAQ